MRTIVRAQLAARTSVALFFALVLTFTANAQSASNGAIEGRIFDEARGEFLQNARVTVEGTQLETFTDDGGYFVLGNVPAGTAKLRVFFTGLAPASVPVAVTAGQTTTKDVTLSLRPQPGAPTPGETVQLSQFVVATSKEMDGAAIAINEQRVAPNIKNVVTADEFGTIVDGTPGEAIKFLPGVMLTYSAGEAREVSINGVPTANVPITVGGFDLASNAGGGTGRQTNFEQVSINSMSRIEVIQSPTPESQGSALGGSVNMVPRSAFERSRPVVNYSVYEMMKDSAKTFRKTPGGALREPYRKITPGFQLSAIVPVNKRFGFTFSANGATQYVPNDVIALQWRGASVPTNGNAFPDTSFDRPYLTQTQINDDLRLNKTTSAGLTFDFKLSPRDTLSFSAMYTYITVDHIGHRMTFTINRVAGGDFGPTFTHGATGQGTLQLEDVNSRYWLGTTSMESLTYRHTGTIWKAEAGAAYSYAGQHNRDIARGILRNSVAQRSNVTIAFDDIFYLRPGRISVTDGTTGAPVDPYRLDNYALTSANYQEDNWLTFRTTAYGNLSRSFNVREVPVTLKGGFDVRQFIRDVRGPQVALTPAVAPNTANPGANNAGRFLDEMLSQRNMPYGFPAAQFVDNTELYHHWQQNPGFFTQNANTIYRSQVNVSKWFSEVISAAYLRSDVALFNRRLLLVGGFRVEQTNTKGEGPLTDPSRAYERDGSGAIRRDAQNRPILKVPTNAGLPYSQLTFIERGSKTDKEYLRILPNINATYNVREDLKLQTAYYYSLGRPNFNQYANGITLPDTDQGAVPANPITVMNAGIKAWSARTLKVRLEYYFGGVGHASIGAYRRDFKDFFGSTTIRATPEFLELYSLDPATYEGYYVATNYNQPGTVRTSGVEFAYKQALTFLPHWARGVQVFGNGTVQRIIGEAGRSSFNNTFFPITGSWGVSLSRAKYSVKMNWNYRSRIRQGAVAAGRGIEPGSYNYDGERLYLDINGDYFFSRRFGLFASFRNVNDVVDNGYAYGASTPAYARFNQRNDFSAAWTFGIKGTF
jgi:iron complex outermembrane recepter protein